jgi:TetR/AcrR family transcriptional regulator, cholesterol catabolism regulator
MSRPVKARTMSKKEPASGSGGREPVQGGSERRRELMSAAASVFARKGVGNTTMRDIADAVGILPGSLYHHFESKDSLLEGILRGMLEDLTAQYEKVRDAGLDPVEAVGCLIAVGLRFVVEEHDVTAIVQNDYTYLHDVEAFGFVEDLRARHQRIWREVLRQGVIAGVFRPDLDLDVVYRSMMGSIVSVVRWYRTDRHLDVGQIATIQTTLYLSGLRDD